MANPDPIRNEEPGISFNDGVLKPNPLAQQNEPARSDMCHQPILSEFEITWLETRQLCQHAIAHMGEKNAFCLKERLMRSQRVPIQMPVH